MTNNATPGRHPQEQRPWYREPWPWVAIGIPAVAVAGGLFTLYLAITHPDPLVVDDDQYQEIRSGLQAQPLEAAASPAARNAREDSDGEH